MKKINQDRINSARHKRFLSTITAILVTASAAAGKGNGDTGLAGNTTSDNNDYTPNTENIISNKISQEEVLDFATDMDRILRAAEADGIIEYKQDSNGNDITILKTKIGNKEMMLAHNRFEGCETIELLIPEDKKGYEIYQGEITQFGAERLQQVPVDANTARNIMSTCNKVVTDVCGNKASTTDKTINWVQSQKETAEIAK